MGNNSCFSLNQKGFSITEVVVAMSLLTMLVVFSVPFIGHSFERIMYSREESEAIFERQEILEKRIRGDEPGYMPITGTAVTVDDVPINILLYEDEEGSLKYFIMEN